MANSHERINGNLWLDIFRVKFRS